MPHALLLSPDDQAVSAISAVLEEMSVSCERPLDGASAAQKLNSHSFDLVLVDCENLPAAKLIFDVCRRGKSGVNAVPIAIVDGRAGLPTAFRLGAELILTKPVAKDQARTTIRTAVGRLRKEELPRAAQAPEVASIAAATPATLEERAQAAAASFSSQPAQISNDTPTTAVGLLSPPAMSTAVEESAAVPLPETGSPEEPSGAKDICEVSKPARPAELSDDPVLADLDRGEVESAPVPALPSNKDAPPKGRNPMVTMMIVVLVVGAAYAGWLYQPGFRALVQPVANRVLAFAGVASRQKAAPAPQAPATIAKPISVRPTAVTAAAPATASPKDAAQTKGISTSTDSPDALRVPAAAPAATSPAPSAPAAAKLESLADSKRTDATTASARTLPSDEDAVILSSRGAEKRLVRHVAPVVPNGTTASGLEGTVVLKTVVDDTGKVESVHLLEGNPALADAAIHAVGQWRYRPYVRDGKSLPFQTIVLVDFQRP